MIENKALLVGVNIDRSNYEFDRSMEELDRLCQTLGINQRFVITQNRDNYDYKYYAGSGKVEEIKDFCDKNDVDLVIFNDELSGSQLTNLSEKIDRKVIDRTTLILDIFSKRAQTKLAKYQIELAQLEYRLPRLKGIGESLSRMGAGIGTRGPGEQKLEIDRRKINRRITDIKRKLEKIKKNRKVQRKRRINSNLPIVSLVGYTNVGKSTLINQFIDKSINIKSKDVYTDDLLFATLDTFSRRIELDKNRKFILNDTVGFVSKLPHFLVEAFKATLEEIQTSDLILHVVDISSNDYNKEIEITENILKELNCIDIPRIIIYNKIDKMEGEFINKGNEVFISAKEDINIEKLIDKISEIIFADHKEVRLLIPFTENDKSSYILDKYDPIEMEYQNEGLYLRLFLNAKDYIEFRDYIIGDEDEKL